MFKLQINEGPAAGTTIELVGTMIIGREGADIAVQGDTEMSRRHARLRVEGGRVLVEDLGSTNGTYVGDRRITEPGVAGLRHRAEARAQSRMTVRFAAPVLRPATFSPRRCGRSRERSSGPRDRQRPDRQRPDRPAVHPGRPRAGAGGRGLRLAGGGRHWWTLVAAGLGLGMNVLDGTVVNVALPSIQRDLHSSFPTVQWVFNAYLLSFAILLATGGRLGDIFGRRRIFLIGVAVFAAASAGCGVAPNNATLLVARAIQGAGAALMIPATLALIVTNFPPELVPRAIGLWTGVTGVALAIGPVVGGVLIKAVSWRAIFYLNIPIALIAFAIALVAARESRDERASRRIDYPGIVTVSLGLTAAVLAVIEASSWGWTSARIIGLLAGSVVALALFVAIERRSEAPIVPLAIFRSLPFVGTNIAGFVLLFSVLGVLLSMAIYMQAVLGFSALKAGLMYLPATVPIALLGPVSARLSERFGASPVVAVGVAIPGSVGRCRDAADREHGLRRDRGRDGPPGDRHGAHRRADLAAGDRLGRGAVRWGCVGRVRDVAPDRCRRRRGRHRRRRCSRSAGRAPPTISPPCPCRRQRRRRSRTRSGPVRPRQRTGSRLVLRNRSPPPCARRWRTRSRGRDS